MSRFAHVQLEINTGNDGQSCVNYTCGHCGHLVAGIGLAYDPKEEQHGFPRRWLVCPSCGEGSIRTRQWQVLPFAPFVLPIQDLPPEVVPIYKEARTCFGAEAYTACELVCRTLLMHIAVDKGADERQSFAFYIEYLQRNGWITPPMTAWVDVIRQIGNDATHRLTVPSKERTESAFMFTVELLRLAYEFPAMTARHSQPAQP